MCHWEGKKVSLTRHAPGLRRAEDGVGLRVLDLGPSPQAVQRLGHGEAGIEVDQMPSRETASTDARRACLAGDPGDVGVGRPALELDDHLVGSVGAHGLRRRPQRRDADVVARLQREKSEAPPAARAARTIDRDEASSDESSSLAVPSTEVARAAARSR